MAPQPQRRDSLTPEYQALVEQYMPMARFEARKLARSVRDFFDYDILESEAYFGLVDAVCRYPSYCSDNKYDPKNLDYFQYFVTQRTRGHLYDFLRQQNHLTRTEYDRAKDIKAKLGEQKSFGAIAEELGVKESDVRKTMANVRDFPMSLNASKFSFGVGSARKSMNMTSRGKSYLGTEEPNQRWDEGAETADLEDLVSLNLLATDQHALSHLLMMKLLSAYDTMTQVQQTVIALRYFCGVGIKDAADMMGMSVVVATKIQTEALEIIVASVRNEK